MPPILEYRNFFTVLSDDSSSVINEYALKFMESLTKAKESSPGLSLKKVEDIELIDMQVSWADHAHRIQRYQHSFILSQSILLTAESNQTFIEESLWDLSLPHMKRIVLRRI